MMKALIVDQFGKTTGSDTLALAELINDLDNFEMSVYLSDTSDVNPINYKTRVFYGFEGAYSGNIIHKSICYLKALKKLEKHIKQEKYDLVNLQWFSIPWLEKSFVKTIKKYSKVVITVHDVIPFNKRFGEMRALKKIYQIADSLLIHTKEAHQQFKDNYPGVNVPMKIISQCFCNKKDYKPLDKYDSRKHLNIPSDAIVYLFYGTIRDSKGLDDLINAFVAAHEQNDKIFLLCAGALHKVDSTYYLNLAKPIIENGYGKFVFDFVPRKEEKYYFSASDVLCLPYKEVTQSGVAQLGLMYELPIIATDVGPMKEVTRDGVNGCLIEKNNSKELIDAILLLTSDKKREAFSKQSRLLGETEFSLDKKAGHVNDAYLECLKKE